MTVRERVCACACVCVCIFEFLCVYMSVFPLVGVHDCERACVCVRLCVCAMCPFAAEYGDETTCVYVFICMCVRERLCVYTSRYGVATISRLVKIIGLFCKRDI